MKIYRTKTIKKKLISNKKKPKLLNLGTFVKFVTWLLDIFYGSCFVLNSIQ